MVEKYILGKTGLEVSRIAFGGIPVMRLTRDEGAVLVRDIIGMGINFIDTAHMYGDSEEKIGDAIREIPRSELIIASKTMARDKEEFLRRLDISLDRLGTDYVDIYQLHNVSSEADMGLIIVLPVRCSTSTARLARSGCSARAMRSDEPSYQPSI